ncbi:MAG: type VI secretion system tube protein Hcp [Bacteroidetes bacterium]|nr:MAG: type VI secretion system tube protein Hcp [Bacteroidota bacterium]
MKKIVLLVVLLISAYTMSYSAVDFYLQIKGAKQGTFKGETRNQQFPDNIQGIAFSYEIKSPRDAATGQASGKRQHQPIKIVKEWGAASPQIFQACVTNEVLPSVVLQFVHVNSDGFEQVYQTITLTNANISGVRMFKDYFNSAQGVDSKELEEVSFTFQKIQIENLDGKTMAVDDWSR